jgi:hypothetical protein
MFPSVARAPTILDLLLSSAPSYAWAVAEPSKASSLLHIVVQWKNQLVVWPSSGQMSSPPSSVVTLSTLLSLPKLNSGHVLLCGILLAVFSLPSSLRIFPLRTAGTARRVTLMWMAISFLLDTPFPWVRSFNFRQRRTSIC